MASIADYGLEDVWGTGLAFGADSSFKVPKTQQTVPVDAIQSMAPVTASESTESSWTSIFKDVLKDVTGYAIKKDAVQSGVVPTAQGVQTAAPGAAVSPAVSNAAMQKPGLSMPVMLGGALLAGVLLVKLAK